MTVIRLTPENCGAIFDKNPAMLVFIGEERAAGGFGRASRLSRIMDNAPFVTFGVADIRSALSIPVFCRIPVNSYVAVQNGEAVGVLFSGETDAVSEFVKDHLPDCSQEAPKKGGV